MKLLKKLVFSASVLLCTSAFSQSDNCSFATTLSVTAGCTPVSGTTAGATPSISGCVGNADDDVWYKFVATSTSHQITVTASASFDPVVQMFSGTCSTLTTLYCQDLGGNGVSENIYATGLTVGATYTIRVYHYGAGSGSSTFTICLTTPPPPPSNNNCSGAISLIVNAACTNTAATSVSATQSLTGCAGTADDDVWFSFVATNSVQTVTVNPSSSMDPVVQLYSGTCGALTSLYCMDNGFTNGNEVINAVGLTPGNTYFIRVYDYYSATGGAAFDICVTGTPTAVPTNDEPCSAVQLPAVTSACNYLNFTTTGATASTATAPAPSACGGSSPYIGGFSATSHDVWFKITVPASGNIYITPQPGYGINDAVMALYSGTCGALTQITCSDDYNYPGTANDLKPYLAGTGLTPGATVYLRYWGYGSTSGNFGLCVSSPTNDACSNALYICDINGYSASTSAAYTPDRPCNMVGNNENSLGVDQPDGTNTGGIFGQGGAWGVGAPAYDVNINNNSWIRFTASATTAVLNVTIGNCWVGNYPSGGIQMQIFSGTNCCNFVPVSDFKENSTGFSITANGLTVGQSYYLMVDGFAGDICNYTITANSGVSFPAITASTSSICVGAAPVTLTGPAGATSYEWLPGGQTTQSITDSPSTTTTYTCIAEGVCGYKQTLTKTITVNPLPAISINSGNPVSVCGNSSVTLSATGANSYSWNTGQTSSSISISPTSTTTYTVTGTSSAGCSASGTATVTYLPQPTITVNSATICTGQQAVLTAGGASTTSNYSWSNGTNGINTITVSPSSASSYTVTGTAANGCTNTAVASVTVNSLPNITVNSPGICNGQTAVLTSSGASSSSNYSWSNGASGVNTISVSPSSLTSYTVTGTGANSCTNTAVATVTVKTLPTITVNSTAICAGQTAVLTAGGAATSSSYSWSTGVFGTNSISVSPASLSSYTVTGTGLNNCTNTAVATVTINNGPVLTTSPTSSPSNCSVATGALTGATVSGSGTLTYSWTNSSNAVVGTSSNLNNQPAGVYNLTVTDGNGCNSVFGPFSITNPGAPSAPSVTAVDTVVCVGESIILNASSTASSPSFNWTGPNSSSSTSSLTINPATSADGGTYAVTVTSSGCTSPPHFVNVVVNALPIASAGNASGSVYCSGDSISLIASGGTIYSWNGPGSYSSAQQNPFISPASTAMSGTYTVTVTDNNSCVSTASTSVTVNQTPGTPTVGANSVIVCEGQTISLTSTSTGATSYSWTGPNGFTSNSQNPSITNSSLVQSGTYIVTASASGCTSSGTPVNVTVNANPAAQAGSSAATICSGNTLNLSSSGGNAYSWSGPSGYTSNSQNPVITNADTSNSGTYIVTVTNAAGCQDSASVSVLVNPTPQTPVAGANAANICEGENILLTASAAGATSYSWSGPNGFISSVQNPSVLSATLAASGTYTVVASIGSCSSSAATVNVTVNPKPVASASATTNTVCSGTNISLNATGGTSYTWTGPGGYISNSQNPVIMGSTVGNSGTYMVIASNASGCSDSASVNITVNQTPNAPMATGDTTCVGDPLTLTATGTGTINWYSDSLLTNTVASNTNIYSPVLSSNSSVIYFITSTDINGCISLISTAAALNYNVVAGVTANPNSGFIPLNVSLTNLSTGVDVNDSYIWSINGNIFDNSFNSSYLFETQGNYVITLIATELSSGCTDSASVDIFADGNITFTIPNIFTPNGDNINDAFEVISHGIASVHVAIYDRWGLKMYEFDGVHASWNGRTTAGVEVPDGTYFYLFNAKDVNGKEYSAQGNLMIMR